MLSSQRIASALGNRESMEREALEKTSAIIGAGEVAAAYELTFVALVAATSKETVFDIGELLRTRWPREFRIREWKDRIRSARGELTRRGVEQQFTRREARSTLPIIQVASRQLRDMSDEALAALHRTNNPPFLFAHAGRMVAVGPDEKMRQVILEISESGLRGLLSRSGDYVRTTSNGEIDVVPPIEICRDILSLAPARWRVPVLEGVVEAPVLRPDGTVLDQAGYDLVTRLYYAPDPSLKMPDIADEPTSDHIEAAIGLIDQAIGEFPFVDQASRANAIAALLTPIVRPAIDAPAPLALVDAPQAGTGKSLFAEVASIIATGRPGEMFSAPRDEDEWRKQITTALLSGTSVAVIDNVTYPLDNADLCKVLTETLHVDRAFRTQQKLVLPVRTTFIATGNNLRVTGDMPRRCYWIRLDAQTSRPFKRSGFKIPDLKEWVTHHRGELLAAGITLCHAWYVAGRPKPKCPPLGSFEPWSVTVGGILEHAGVFGFLENAEELYQSADDDSQQWEGFLLALDEAFDGDPFTVAQLVEKVHSKTWSGGGGGSELTAQAAGLQGSLPDFLAEAVERDGYFRRRAGKAFAARVGRRFGESQIHLTRGQVFHNVQQWRVVRPSSERGVTK
jgi:hypothetical protein